MIWGQSTKRKPEARIKPAFILASGFWLLASSYDLLAERLTVKMDSILIVNLQNPKERFFGRLVEVTPPGVTVRGIDINAFEDWMDSITHREESGVQPTTVFFPLHRIEKIILDEGIGAIPSLSDTFLTKVGMTVQDHLE